MVSALEIILIIVVIVIVALIARILRMGRVATGQITAKNQDTTNQPEKTGKANLLNRSGITLVIIGIIAMTAAVSLFRWALQGYLWATILIALGILLVVLSRKKR